MRAGQNLRQLAAAGTLALLSQRALALPQPQAQETVQPAPSPWVTVNSAGVGLTLTPHVITANGAVSTQNPAPPSLTVQGTYTVSPNGRPSTYTGMAPVATATGKPGSAAGAFLACTHGHSAIYPFCQPHNGAVMYQGSTYYSEHFLLRFCIIPPRLTATVTWNPKYFGEDPDVLVEVEASYMGTSGLGSKAGTRVPASVGFYAWTIPNDFLAQVGRGASLNMTFNLAKDVEETEQPNDTETILGPTVLVVSGTPPAAGGSSDGSGSRKSGPSAVAIAVPVVVAAVVLLLAGLCVWSWRRHGTVPIVGALGKVRRRSSGYGVRQSHSERTGARDGAGLAAGGGIGSDKAGIQLTDRDSWSPTGTRHTGNVFREEVRRQERER